MEYCSNKAIKGAILLILTSEMSKVCNKSKSTSRFYVVFSINPTNLLLDFIYFQELCLH